jgi:transporter family-2 protein
MPTPALAAIMFAAGIGIPVLAALNAQLGARIGAPATAAAVLFVVAFAAATLTAAATGGLRALPLLPAQPKYLFLAGVLVAFYILSITWIAPHLGLGNAIVLVLLGQLVAAAVIDHFALIGARETPVTLTRAAGIALMGLGVFLTQKG